MKYEKDAGVKKRTFGFFTILIAGVTVLTFVSYVHWQDVALPTEKPIVAVITSYNNELWCERNLRTLFMQKYNNWRAIYVNDCSTDKTLEKVQNMVKEAGQEHRVQIISNAQRRGKMANLYYAIHTIHDRAIVLDYDGDDWFKHDKVFQVLNEAYQDPNVWCTYGQYENYPAGTIGFCKPLSPDVIEKNAHRSSAWITSHLRTFYAGLFKRIKKEDFFYNGDFYPITSDQAYMIPVIELANTHIKFISEVLYVYNNINPIMDYKTRVRLQQECYHHIRAREPYKPLTEEQFALPSQEVMA